MIPLVLQLQAEALDQNSRIADLMRKSKVVAVKLGLADFKAWVDNEINGYPNLDDLPDYRKLAGRLKARNPMRGWISAIIHDHELELMASTVYVSNPIGPLEETISRSLEDSGYVMHPLSGGLQATLAEMFGCETEFQVHIPAATASGILDVVRSRVLDWSLSLEQAGILGEGMKFNTREREVAKAMSGGNTYNINGNVAVLGDVAGSSVLANQSVNYTQSDLTELRGIVDQISGATGQLRADTRQAVVAALGDARTELDAVQPDHGRLKLALTSIRTACEGAAGDLIATGIVGLISKFLS
jgi:hypothetical protein